MSLEALHHDESRRTSPAMSKLALQASAFRPRPAIDFSGEDHRAAGHANIPVRLITPTAGKIERWHQTLKTHLLENYYLPGQAPLSRTIPTGAITRASTMADAFRRGQTILLERAINARPSKAVIYTSRRNLNQHVLALLGSGRLLSKSLRTDSHPLWPSVRAAGVGQRSLAQRRPSKSYGNVQTKGPR